ncbi:nucleoside 2-deoxyribosyltransferase [Lentibacillus sp. L22]|uniref:nucleoside 2-deoxyribosyltransferase n=1 Tax=Lentibacillus TaxID=175304 RepID=UPI0022B17857|nr:nucleoside 2-deoxyribosyltransferase [Lentibacillus daqui]
MNFYIASSFANKELVRYVALKLTVKGYKHTYDWTINQQAIDMKTLKVIGEAEKRAIAACDIFILLLPAGKGSHTELGLALALEKDIYIYSPENAEGDLAISFYYVDGVKRFHGKIDDFLVTIGLA